MTSPLRPQFSPTVLACLACLACLPACQPDQGPGTLAIDYTLGNSKTCEEVGVTRIEAELVRGTGDDRVVLYNAKIACGDELFIDDIEAKTYEFEIKGYDSDNIVILDNLADSESERRIEIFEAADSQLDIDLTERPATLSVRWRLGAEGFADCDGVGIDRFEIKAYQQGGGGIMLEAELDCTLDGEGTGNWRVLADPDRALIGVLFAEVGIQALDSSGAEVGDAATFEFEPVGPGYPVQLAVECDALGCQPEG